MKDKGSSILATEKGAKNSSSDYNEEKPKSKPKRKKWSLRKKILVSFFSIVFIAGLYFVSAVIYNLKTLRSHLIKPKNGTYTEYYDRLCDCVLIFDELDFSAKRGDKMSESAYVDGELNGLYKSWYRSGIKESEMTYVDGKLNGPYKLWHSSGIKHIEANILNDTLHGYYKEYDSKGINKPFGEYSMGERVGVWDIVIYEEIYKVRLPVKEKEDGYYFFDSQGNPMLVISKIQTDNLGIDSAFIAANDSEFGGYTNWRLPYISEAKYFYILNYLKKPNLKGAYSKGLDLNISQRVWTATVYYGANDSYYRLIDGDLVPIVSNVRDYYPRSIRLVRNP
jgi:hypothetical protein